MSDIYPLEQTEPGVVKLAAGLTIGGEVESEMLGNPPLQPASPTVEQRHDA